MLKLARTSIEDTEPDFTKILRAHQAEKGDTEASVLSAAKEYAIAYHEYHNESLRERINELLPADCPVLEEFGYSDVKFCPNRLGDGGVCQWCK